MNANRGTGRTSRMLRRAWSLSKGGRPVYVVAYNQIHKDRLQSQYINYYGEDGVKFETPESLGNFDWTTMTLNGAHPRCVVLVDHFAIEAKFAKLIDMLHAFDLPN